MKKLFTKGVLAVVGVLLSLSLSILALVDNNQSVPKTGGLTNYDEVAMGNASVKYNSLFLGAAATTTSYTNNSKTSELVRFGSLSTDGTASSSFRLWFVASTTTAVPSTQVFTNITPTGNSRIISNWVLATSTAATTTNNLKFISQNNGNTDATVVLKSGESVLLVLQRGDVNCIPLPAVNGCEAATSTNRGFNVSGLLETVSTSTQR